MTNQLIARYDIADYAQFRAEFDADAEDRGDHKGRDVPQAFRYLCNGRDHGTDRPGGGGEPPGGNGGHEAFLIQWFGGRTWLLVA